MSIGVNVGMVAYDVEMTCVFTVFVDKLDLQYTSLANTLLVVTMPAEYKQIAPLLAQALMMLPELLMAHDVQLLVEVATNAKLTP